MEQGTLSITFKYIKMEQNLSDIRLLFFDTETTGLPKDFYAPVRNTRNWPHVVQLSWIVTDGFGKTLDTQDFIIKPCRWKIPLSASRIHGITTEVAKEKGTPIKKVLDLFLSAVTNAQMIIAHNIGFDRSVIESELFRNKLEYDLCHKNCYDTMLETTEFCAIERWNGEFKWPRLQELHMCLFGKSFKDAHNSLADVKATKKCFFELAHINFLDIIKEVNF